MLKIHAIEPNNMHLVLSRVSSVDKLGLAPLSWVLLRVIAFDRSGQRWSGMSEHQMFAFLHYSVITLLVGEIEGRMDAV